MIGIFIMNALFERERSPPPLSLCFGCPRELLDDWWEEGVEELNLVRSTQKCFCLPRTRFFEGTKEKRKCSTPLPEIFGGWRIGILKRNRNRNNFSYTIWKLWGSLLPVAPVCAVCILGRVQFVLLFSPVVTFLLCVLHIRVSEIPSCLNWRPTFTVWFVLFFPPESQKIFLTFLLGDGGGHLLGGGEKGPRDTWTHVPLMRGLLNLSQVSFFTENSFWPTHTHTRTQGTKERVI